MADYPDWTLTNTVASQSLPLFSNGIGAALPLSQQIDVSLYESVDITLRFAGAGTTTPVSVYVQWLIGTTVVADDICTVWTGQVDSLGAGSTVSLPCRGDIVNISVLNAQAGVTGAMTVTGSTRALEEPRYGGTFRQVPGLLAGGAAVAFSANESKVPAFGPVTGPITAAFINGTQSLAYNITCWGVNSTGVAVSAVIAAGTVAAAANVTIGPFYCPNMAMTIQAVNGAGVAAVMNYAVTGGQ